MRRFCDNAANFFTPVCKTWLKNVNDAVKDDLALKYCANSSDPFCGCYTAKVPPEWENNTTKKALFRCLDPKCEGGRNPEALKPYDMVCPTTYVDCRQEEVKLKLIQSGIDRATIEQNCGSINLGGPGGDGGRDNDDDDDSPPAGSSKPLSKTTMYGLLGGGIGLIVLIIIIIIVLSMGGKKTKVTTGGGRRR